MERQSNVLAVGTLSAKIGVKGYGPDSPFDFVHHCYISYNKHILCI